MQYSVMLRNQYMGVLRRAYINNHRSRVTPTFYSAHFNVIIDEDDAAQRFLVRLRSRDHENIYFLVWARGAPVWLMLNTRE